MTYASKIVLKWNGHLEIFSLPQAIEIVRQFVVLQSDYLQKTVAGCPFYDVNLDWKKYVVLS